MPGIHLNWTDGVVVVIILGCALSGLINGFVNSIYRIASFFLSVFLAAKFIPPVSAMLMKTSISTGIKKSIMTGLLNQSGTAAAQTGAVQTGSVLQQSTAADSFISKLPLPEFLKQTVLKQIPDPTKIFSLSKIADSVSTELTKIVISILSLIILFIVIRIAFSFIRFLLKGIVNMPVFKQIDKTGGFALGAVEGLLMVFIIMALLALLNTSVKYPSIYQDVNSSVIARFFYQNNFIISWLFKK